MSTPWIIHSPLDMHLHLRQGSMLQHIAPASAHLFAGAVIMPNLVPPVDSLEKVLAYRDEIRRAAQDDRFTPYMTLFFRGYTRAELEAAKPHIIGIKLYPEGVTTNSAGGVVDWRAFHQVFLDMQDLHIPLLVHGETHGFVMDREREFTAVYRELATRYPGLTIVMEHISTVEAVALLDVFPHVYATVTLHHLLLTLDDLAGGLLNPHLFCKPILKRPEDRDALQAAVLAGHPNIMFGSDSAPHPRSQKECCGCAAGIFSAPVALSMLADFFDRQGKRQRIQGFVSGHAVKIYGIAPPEKAIALEQIPWTVPDHVGEAIPFMAGKVLPWLARPNAPGGLS